VVKIVCFILCNFYHNKKIFKWNFLAYTLEVLIEAVKLSSRNSCYNLLSRVYESISSDIPLTTLDIIVFSPYLRGQKKKKKAIFSFGFAFPHYQYLRTLLRYAVRLSTCSYVIRICISSVNFFFKDLYSFRCWFVYLFLIGFILVLCNYGYQSFVTYGIVIFF